MSEELYRFVEYDIPDTDERGEKLVSVEPDYEAMRKAWDAIAPCYCGPEYTDRGLISPHCANHIVREELEMLWTAALGVSDE